MLEELTEDMQSPGTQSLARTFSRVGKLGFWVQIVIGSMPFILMGYTLIFAQSPAFNGGARAGLAVVDYLTLGSLVILLFTVFWFRRYVRLAERIADPQQCPPASAVIASVWTGLIVGGIGLLFSMLVMLIDTAHLLFYFLAAPQGGVPVFQTPSMGQTSWVSAVDMANLMALSMFIFAEIVVLILGLWLLFRTMHVSKEFPQPAEANPAPDAAA